MEVTRLRTPHHRDLLAPSVELREEMRRLFEDLWNGFAPQSSLQAGRDAWNFAPSIDVTENEKSLLIQAELPGVDDKDVEVELLRDRLVLRGEKREEKTQKLDGSYLLERRFGTFRREIPLPWEVDTEKTSVEASFHNGILTVEVPRPQELHRSRRRIAIHH